MAAFPTLTNMLVGAAKARFPPILWKNNVLLAQKVTLQIEHERLSYQALHVCCGAGKIFASLRRF